MQDIFVSKIHINEVRHIRDFEISLSETERKHLIITGKNGSGKTSLIKSAEAFFSRFGMGYLSGLSRLLQIRDESEYLSYVKEVGVSFNNTKVPPGIDDVTTIRAIVWEIEAGNFIFKSFAAKRNTEFNEPSGVQKINLRNMYALAEKPGADFYQYIVNLKADRSFARDEGDKKTIARIDEWFENFDKALAGLFDSSELKLTFDRKTYQFHIVENGKAPYTLNQLSDGYSAILDIVTELIMRMEEHKQKSYDVQGVVLIDEIETHLHVDLQKKILPFLTAFFPKIQFIVTTHSPFVISSVSNAVICDLEKRIVTEDLSGYSYDTILESYFDVDKYSAELKKKIEEYERLEAKETLTEQEQDEWRELARYLDDTPKFLATELAVKLQQIKLRRIGRRK